MKQNVVSTLILIAAAILVAHCGSDNKGANTQQASQMTLLQAVQTPGAVQVTACPENPAFSGVVICHVPPGNPNNPQTICIGTAAIQAHLNHHTMDFIGACVGASPSPSPVVLPSPSPSPIILPSPSPSPFGG